jgi:hypothetical protein
MVGNRCVNSLCRWFVFSVANFRRLTYIQVDVVATHWRNVDLAPDQIGDSISNRPPVLASRVR